MPADLVQPLLNTLQDNHEFEGVLWSIVHAAESVLPIADYEPEMLRSLPTMVRRSPQWAKTLVMRWLNSHDSFLNLMAVVPSAGADERHAIRRVAHELIQSPRFAAKAEQVMTIANAED